MKHKINLSRELMLTNPLDEVSILKVPPHSIEAEQAVLGANFLSTSAIDEISFLTPDDFYRKEHRIIFQAILDLTSNNKETDIVTVAELLETRHQINEVGMRMLSDIAENTPSASNAKAYGEIVHKRSILRKLLTTCNEINDTVFNPEGKNAIDILDEASNKIYNLSETQSTGELETTAQVVNEALESIDHRYQHKGQLFGLSTGFDDIDKRLQGLAPQDLVIVAGRPAMGKTSIVMNMAEHNAVDKNKTVAVFSMEMSKNSLVQRMISTRAKVPFGKIRSGELEQFEWEKIADKSAEIAKSKLIIDDSSALTHSQIRSRLRKIQRKQGLDLVVIDYIQLMRSSNDRENRTTQISDITAGLKNIAKDFNVPVIALSQLNRSLESRTNKRPIMSDLRESGSIEQDADVILFLYRDEVYDEESPNKGIAEAIIRKQRNGEIGTNKLVFQGQFLKFENYIGY